MSDLTALNPRLCADFGIFVQRAGNTGVVRSQKSQDVCAHFDWQEVAAVSDPNVQCEIIAAAVMPKDTCNFSVHAGEVCNPCPA